MSLALIGSLAGGAIGAIGANKAAKAQTKIAKEQLALQKQVYSDTTNNLAPYLSGGNLAQSALLYENGLGPRPTIGGNPLAIETVPGAAGGYTPASMPSAAQRQMYGSEAGMYAASDALRRSGIGGQPTYRVGGRTFATLQEAQAYANANPQGGTAYQGFQKTPGYDFALQQGLEGLQSTAAAQGGLYSGATMRDANTYAQGYANQQYDNYYQRLAALAGNGQNAAAQQGSAGANYATGATNALGNMGNAQSAGAIGFSNALQGGISNALGAYAYNRANPSGRI